MQATSGAALNSGEAVMLDGVTLDRLQERLAPPVRPHNVSNLDQIFG